MKPLLRLPAAWRRRLQLPPNDLLRNAAYRRLFTSILCSSLGGQVTMLALPLTAALLLHATPTQMGWLTTMELLPFVLFSLPAGVWLDRVRKLPVYVAGEFSLAVAVLTIPLAWALGWLSIAWLYVVGFLIGTVYTTAGSAAQIVLTQVVPRERLVEAHAKNALATSGAEVVGPGLAGALIKAVGAPMALVIDALLLLVSVGILRGVDARENRQLQVGRRFWPQLKEGLRFVAHHRLLIALAVAVGLWQMCHNAALVVQILYATRELGMSERAIGLAYVAMGAGTVLASTLGHRISERIGPGPCLTLGIGCCGLGWLLAALVPPQYGGIAAFVAMLVLFGVGAVLIFINFLALRQAVTPEPLLGRMTSIMRWLIILPAGPGALLGGWLGEHVALRATLLFSGVTALLLAGAALRHPVIRAVRSLPSQPKSEAVPPEDPAADAMPLKA